MTDENGKITSASYTDSYFWRPATSSDQLSNITSFSYPSATAIETTMSFNSGASVANRRITVDGLGRMILNQRRQGPTSNYDSVEIDYDIAGLASKSTMPYSAAAGTLCSGACPGTSQTYDSLGRLQTITDSGGGSGTYTYPKNDVYKTVPAPAGENPKDKQSEYDALGRLTSVCETTSSANGGGNCAQSNTGKFGYWTRYAYDILGNLTSVTQNAQASAQSRSYFYDMLSRMTSETNPETGTTQYFYDTAPATPGVACSGTYPGDVVKRYDANGNTTCYTYDSLHRVTSVTYPSTVFQTRY